MRTVSQVPNHAPTFGIIHGVPCGPTYQVSALESPGNRFFFAWEHSGENRCARPKIEVNRALWRMQVLTYFFLPSIPCFLERLFRKKLGSLRQSSLTSENRSSGRFFAHLEVRNEKSSVRGAENMSHSFAIILIYFCGPFAEETGSRSGL